MHKVNWTSDKSSDFVSNFDILAQSLKKFQVQKELSFERLMSGDDHELMSLLEWLKMFSMSNRNLGQNYDAVARRGGKEPNFGFADRLRQKNHANQDLLGAINSNQENVSIPRIGQGLDPKTVQKLAKFDLMKSERDFYYDKLKDIDHVLDLYKDSAADVLIQAVKDILYLAPEKLGNGPDQSHEYHPGQALKFDQARNISANFSSTDGFLSGNLVGTAQNMD